MELSLVKCLKLIEDSSQISNMILVHRVYPVGTLCIFYSIIYIYVKEDAKHTTLSKHVLDLKRSNTPHSVSWEFQAWGKILDGKKNLKQFFLFRCTNLWEPEECILCTGNKTIWIQAPLCEVGHFPSVIPDIKKMQK